MLLFLDTEFTDFLYADLISIGLISEDGLEFYAERNDYDRTGCSAFVKEAVLPRLGAASAQVGTESEIGNALQAWLGQFDTAEVCFDYTLDWEFFVGLVRDPDHYKLPPGVVGRNIKAMLDPWDIECYWRENGRLDHHALHDARANRSAFQAALVRHEKMDMPALGNVIRARRKALGLTQRRLAKLTALSHHTVQGLEASNERTIENLGFQRVRDLLGVIGLKGEPPTTIARQHKQGLWMAAKTSSVSCKTELSIEALQQALATGQVPAGYAAQLGYFLDEAPVGIVVMAVEEAAQRESVLPRLIWSNVAKLAKALSHARKDLWL